MYRPPFDPRDSIAATAPSWWAIFAHYAILAAVPIALWAINRPVVAVLALGVVATLSFATRRSYRLVRCFYDCEAMTFDLGGTARITIRQTPTDDLCCPTQ